MGFNSGFKGLTCWPTWKSGIFWESVELQAFFGHGKCPGLSDGVIPLHKKARPHTAEQTRKLRRISAGKRWTIIHTGRIWHPASLMRLLPWKRTCQGIVSPATKTSKLAAITWLTEQAGALYASGFHKLIAQCDKCLNCQGDCLVK